MSEVQVSASCAAADGKGGTAGRTIVVVAGEVSTGGLGSYMRDISEGLGERGWRVHLVVTERRGDRYDAVHGLAGRHDLSGVPLSRHKVATLASLIERIAPGVLLANHAALAHYALPLMDRSVRAVAVVHSDDPAFYRTAALLGRRVYRWVAPAPGVAQRMASALGATDRARVRTIPHGVPAVFFAAAAGAASRDPCQIVFCGHVGPNKGADLLPGIMRQVWRAQPRAFLAVVGTGPLLAALRRQFDEDVGAGRSRFTGDLPREEVAALLGSAGVLLLPTRIEGFGLAVAEAMAAGAVPVVSRLHGVTDSLVDDLRTGFLAEAGDITGFASTVTRLISHPATLEECSRAARAEASKSFCRDVMLDAYEGLFEECDDRVVMSRRGWPGWWREAGGAFLDRAVSPAWVGRRIREGIRAVARFGKGAGSGR